MILLTNNNDVRIHELSVSSVLLDDLRFLLKSISKAQAEISARIIVLW